MPNFYNFKKNGVVYSFDDIFIRKDFLIPQNLWVWGNDWNGGLGTDEGNDKITPVTTFAGGSNWKQVSAGFYHSAGIKVDGTLWVWGNNSNCQLGINERYNDKYTPVTTFAGGTDWKQVTAGYHTAAIKTDGTLWLWGPGWYSQLGNKSYDSASTPITTFAGGTNWKQVSIGYNVTAAIKTDGTLWTWGYNYYGQLGKQDRGYQINYPVTTFAGGTDWVDASNSNPEDLYSISLESMSSAIKADGTLWTWGYNSINGYLGTNDNTSRSTPVTTFAGGTNWKQVSAGLYHTAAIKTDGTLWVWGYNAQGQLGNNDNTSRSTPVTTFAGGTNWKQVSSGNNHSAAIKTDNTLWVWGYNYNGHLGTNDKTNKSTPVTTFAGGTNWKQVSSGTAHTTAIKTDGTLWVWGYNYNGPLGTNDTTNRSTPVTTFAGGTNWKQVSSGTAHTTAIKTDGTIWSWGLNDNGQLGQAKINIGGNYIITPITTFAGGTNWLNVASSNSEDLYTISAGVGSSCAIKNDGTLWVWGRNNSKELGTNDTNTKSTPVTTFAGGTNWKQVSVDFNHTAAIKTDGSLWTWGRSTEGQLGRPPQINKSTPITTFAGGTNWADTPTTNSEDLYTISAGADSSYAIKTDGTLWIWGLGSSGRLGNNDTTSKSTPVTTFAGGTNWKQVSSGGAHTAAIKTDGTLWVWGENNQGRLGTNDTINRSTPVTTFTGGTDWKQVSTGYNFTAAIKTDGTIWSWGSNNFSQLGNGILNGFTRSTPITTFAGEANWADTPTTNSEDLYTINIGRYVSSAIKTDGTLWVWGYSDTQGLGINQAYVSRYTPVTTFAGGTDWKQVSCSLGYWSHTAAIKTDGTLWIWGENDFGRLGHNDPPIGNVNIPTPITTFAGGTDWKQVSLGSGHTAAVKTDGTLWTWGRTNEGQLGVNDSIINRSTPTTTFAGGTDWKQVSAGYHHTSAIKTDGTLWIWGQNTNSILGLGLDGLNRSTPVTTFAGGTNWKQVSSGRFHTSAIKTDGTLWVWGDNYNGRLGTNDGTQRNTPVTTFAGGTNWKQVSSGYAHIAAIKTDGTLWTWGRGGDGQLGNNTTTNRSTPVTTFAGGTNWKQVHCGREQTIALQDNGVNKILFTWGSNSGGQLGNNYNNIFYAPSKITVDTNWNHVSCGYYHSSAIKTDGTLWIWGNNNTGQLGTNNTITRSTPVTTFAGGTNWKQVSAGFYHTAAIKTDGTLWTWGQGGGGVLGNNNTVDRSTPVTTFAGGTNWKQVSTATKHTTAVKTDGTLWVWGQEVFGILGTNTENISTIIQTPVTTFAGGTDWRQVDCSSNHTIAIKGNGSSNQLYVFGRNDNGTLGDGSFDPSTNQLQVLSNTFNWNSIVCGNNRTAAIKTDGTLWTWGNNSNAQLGTNDTTQRNTPVTTFAGGTNWKQVSFTALGTLAIKTDGTLWVWGYNWGASLGTNEAFTNYFTPVTTFAGGTDWKQVSGGGYYQSAGIKTDGTLWVWGYNNSGHLGTNDKTNKSTPVTTFAGGTNWKQVSTSDNNTAAIKTDGTLWTWGANWDGRLGTNDTTTRYTPVTTFAGGTDWLQVEIGPNSLIALKGDGTNNQLYVWGNEQNSILGNFVTTRDVYRPNQIFGNTTDWKQVSSGNRHTSALKTDGTLWVWGRNYAGELGINDQNNTILSTPVTTFAGGTDWKQVYSSKKYYSTIALKGDAEVYVFGSNGNYQLGIAEYYLNTNGVPSTTFAGGTNWKQVSTSGYHTSSIKTDGTLWIWGADINGRLGINNSGYEYNIVFTPVTTFAGGNNWKYVSNNYTYNQNNLSTSAIKNDGTLWTWGYNNYGQLGTNDTLNKFTPVTTFAGGTDWKQVHSGYKLTSAIKTDGTLWTWGYNLNGNLGINDETGNLRSTPVTTFAGRNDWKQVSTSYHSLAITYESDDYNSP